MGKEFLVGVIDAQGELTGVYRDEVPLYELGPYWISRASEIEFNHDDGRWEARLPTGEFVGAHPSRQTCVELEVAYLEQELLRT